MMDLKTAARARIDAEAAALVALSHAIADDPELAFNEHRAMARCATVLEDAGFVVTRGAYGLDTAFEATIGTGTLRLVLCCEYDALPDVGHACGHNIIAASAVGAALALASAVSDLDCTVVVLGTPAEEGGGGKVALLERGAFRGAHGALMIHPWPTERLEATCLAVDHFEVAFTGREAHASAAPFEGRNAADAMTIAQVGLGLLRQQLNPGDQVHGIVTGGGAAANIIPAHVTGSFMIRASTADALTRLSPRVRACFDAGALATGTSVAFTQLGASYTHMVSHAAMLSSYRANAEALGRTFELDDEGAAKPTISTDMANVSLEIPSIHPLLKVDADGSVNHQHAFAAVCRSASGDRAVLDGATALAWTVIDIATEPELRSSLT